MIAAVIIIFLSISIEVLFRVAWF